MAVYSTRRFLAMILASVLVGVLVVSAVSVVLPAYFGGGPAFRAIPRVSSPVISAGSTSKFSVDLRSLNGFSGLVELAAIIINAPSGIQTSVSPASLTLSPGATATVTVTVTSTATTPPGDYFISLKETSGTLSNTDTVNVKVASLGITASPSSLNFSPGASGSSSITIASVNGVSGNVVLVSSTSAAGPTASTSPTSFYLNSGGIASSVLTVKSVAQGVFDVTVTAIGGGGQFYQSVTLPVTASSSTQSGDFSLSLLPSSVAIAPGSSENVLVRLGSLSGCVCLVTLSTSAPAVGFGIGVTPYIVGLTAGGTADSTLFINADSTATAGNYTVTVTGTSVSLTHSALLSIRVSSGPVPDFTVSVNPVSFSVVEGSSYPTQVSIRSLGGFTGSVSLTSGIIPILTNGPTATANPSSVVLSSGGTASSTLTISTTSSTPINAGYNFTVTASSGTLFHTAYGFFTVVSGGSGPYYSVTASPASLTVQNGSSVSSTIMVGSLNGFHTYTACPSYWGILQISSQVSPQVASGPTVSFNPSCLTLKAGGTNSSAMTVATSAGTPLGLYTISVSVCYQISPTGPTTCDAVTVYVQVFGQGVGITSTSSSSSITILGTAIVPSLRYPQRSDW